MRFLLFLSCFVSLTTVAQPLYQKPAGLQSRLSSFENKNGDKGGGGPMEVVKELVNKGVPLQPITIDKPSGFVRLFETPLSINDAAFPDGWVNFYRSDDYTSVSYFYLNKTSAGLPNIPPVDVRTRTQRMK